MYNKYAILLRLKILIKWHKMNLKKLLKKLTLREKLLQLTQLSCVYFDKDDSGVLTGPIQNFNFTEEDIHDMGSVLNSFGVEKMISMQKDHIEKSKHGIPLIFMQDVIHGYRTMYPIQLALGCSFNMQMIKECSSMAAKECSVDGVQLTFAPMVDLARDARWGRVMETTGEDPYLNSLAAKAQVEGFQGDLGKYKVAGCVKHFAGYGAAEGGLDYNTVDMSERTLREYYFPAYKSALDAGVKSVMTSFNVVDGIPAVGNKWLVDDVLRKEWGFDGLVISDFNAVGELIVHGVASDKKQAGKMSLDAGVDIEMMSNAYATYGEELVRKGNISIKQIDKAVMRVLKLKQELGLFENPYRDADPELSKQIILCKEHRDLARKMAEESAVLLKNDGILPISKQVESIAVIGPLGNTLDIKGSWACAARANDTITVFEGLKNLYGEDKVKFEQGCQVEFDATNTSEIKNAVNLAKECKAVIMCLGEKETDSGESKSKTNLELPKIQYKLLEEVLKVNKNVAVVLFTGRPLAIKPLSKIAPAILNMWMPGTEGGNALANLISGDAIPSGKLSMTFPASTGQCPIYYNRYRTGRPSPDKDTTYGYFASYIDGDTYPLYPFGYGMSYSKFEYSNLSISQTQMKKGQTIRASVIVKNVGQYTAKEVVQMYIADVVGSTVRPVKELKGFEKITLTPNESKVVEFEINDEKLAFYGSDLKRKVEKGVFKVFIGKDSDVEEFIEFTRI